MAVIAKIPYTPPEQFLEGIEPKPVQPPAASARVLGVGVPEVDAPGGIQAGQKLRVEFDTYFPPLPDAEGYGSAKLQLNYKVNGETGTVPPVPAAGWWGYGSEVPLDLPKDASGPMELSFVEIRKDGTLVPHPQVYTVDVMPADAPIIKFDEQWRNIAEGALQPGGAFKIAYDVDRLRKQLDLGPNELPRITAHVSFDGKYPVSQPVLTSDALGEHVDLPEFRIPADAKSLRIWFSGGPMSGGGSTRLKYDSDFGADFRIDLP